MSNLLRTTVGGRKPHGTVVVFFSSWIETSTPQHHVSSGDLFPIRSVDSHRPLTCRQCRLCRAVKTLGEIFICASENHTRPVPLWYGGPSPSSHTQYSRPTAAIFVCSIELLISRYLERFDESRRALLKGIWSRQVASYFWPLLLQDLGRDDTQVQPRHTQFLCKYPRAEKRFSNSKPDVSVQPMAQRLS